MAWRRQNLSPEQVEGRAGLVFSSLSGMLGWMTPKTSLLLRLSVL